MGAPFERFDPTGPELPIVVEIPHAGLEIEAQFLEPLIAPARAIAREPAALEIRRLQTLAEIGAEHNSTIVLTIPTEFTALAAKLGNSG